MTYAQFLLTFVLVPVGVLAFAVRRRVGHWWFRGLPVVIFLAVAYTGPWDHFIISEGVWGYPPGRIWGPTIGLVPLEEYGFFVLQTTFTSLLLLLFLPAGHSSAVGSLPYPSTRNRLPNPSPDETGEGGRGEK